MQTAPLRALIALVLVVLMAVGSGCRAQPSTPGSGAASGGPAAGSSRASRLQEVAPPGAVAALNERLAERAPRLEIVAPADDALLPDGPWTLQLRVSDWPLADAQELGLGPHLVVQLDQQPPITISSPEAAAAVSMPPLQPGSHRLSVYAARPWGEAVKAPGALRQIRVHRVSRNTAELPPRGSAQLIVASPAQPDQQEPVLLDWLLLDAPLQHLSSGDDARWRLRVSLNGDSVLVDRQTPLWLKGFRPGSNALQLELLDGRGEPLNPPFNSVVREVVIGGGNRPAWRRTNLSPDELARLSGEPVATTSLPEAGSEAALSAAEPAPAAPPRPPEGRAPQPPEPAMEPAGEPPSDTPAPTTAADQRPGQKPAQPPAPLPEAQPAADPEPVEVEAAAAPAAAEERASEPSSSQPSSTPAASGEAPPLSGASPEATTSAKPPMAEPGTAEQAAPSSPSAPATAAKAPVSEKAARAAAAARDSASQTPPSADDTPNASPTPAQPEPGTAPPVERQATPSAREQVNADGSLLRPKPRGPLAGLREKLGG